MKDRGMLTRGGGSWGRCDCWIRIVLALHHAMNVGAEFLHYVRETVPHVELSIGTQVAPPCAIFRGGVDIRDARGRRISKDFVEVEPGVPGIGARYHQSSQGVKRAVHEGTMPQLIITRGFVKH